jgi:hypothetical protein
MVPPKQESSVTSLVDQLAAMRLAAFGDGAKPGRIPADAAAVMHRVTAEQRASGYRARMPALGSPLPGFTLPDTDGAPVASAALLARGPLVVSFFRGAW